MRFPDLLGAALAHLPIRFTHWRDALVSPNAYVSRRACGQLDLNLDRFVKIPNLLIEKYFEQKCVSTFHLMTEFEDTLINRGSLQPKAARPFYCQECPSFRISNVSCF